jgi:hypothetical protein
MLAEVSVQVVFFTFSQSESQECAAFRVARQPVRNWNAETRLRGIRVLRHGCGE